MAKIVKTTGELHAAHDGTIAGMPAEFERTLAGLRDIVRRAEAAGLAKIVSEAKQMIPIVERQWRDVDAMIPRGPAIKREVVAAAPEMELI